MVALLHEQNQIWVVRLFYDAREVHGVVHLILRLEHFLETKVVMAFLQSIERYILVMLDKDIFIGCGGGCSIGQDRVVSLRQVKSIPLRSSLCGLETETVLHVYLVVPTMAAVSHFNINF